MVKFLKDSVGFTLQEILIVLTVFAFLIALLGIYFFQLLKAHDGKRKSDLQLVKIAFEDYFNDYNCYPRDLDMFTRCGSKEFLPYIKKIPCDPTGAPYKIVVEESDCPSWFIIYTNMENKKDPQVMRNECFGGCRIEGITYNYAVASDNITVAGIARCSGGCYIRKYNSGTGAYEECNGPRGENEPCPESEQDRCFRDKDCDATFGCEVKSCHCFTAGPDECIYEPL